ncbi:nucleotidyltransferase family protein [Bacteroidota bacterium]
MKKSINQISKRLREMNNFIKSEYNVTEIRIFGSYAKKKNNSKSDLDLLVTFSKTPSLLKFIELENFLSDKIGVKVDLVMEDSIKYQLKESILSSAVQI